MIAPPTQHKIRTAHYTYRVQRLSDGSWTLDGDGLYYTAFPSSEGLWDAIGRRERDARRYRGECAVRDLWQDWCAREAYAARSTVAGALRDRRIRVGLAENLGRRVPTSLTGLAPVPVLTEAMRILRARAERRAAAAISLQARTGQPGRILALVPVYRARRQSAARLAAITRLRAGRIGRAALEALLPTLLESVSADADAAVRAVVAAVGEVGEQAQADLREMRTSENFRGKRGRHHRRDVTTLHRVERLSDWSAALITLRDYTSCGSGSGGDYTSRGGSGFRCYLVVRDSSNGTAHLLRVPPKFGNAGTQFFDRFAGPRQRVRAAIAWTFGREASEYHPAVEA